MFRLAVQPCVFWHTLPTVALTGHSGQLDLHHLSEAGAEAALRAWLQQEAAAGRRPPAPQLCIVTGATRRDSPVYVITASLHAQPVSVVARLTNQF